MKTIIEIYQEHNAWIIKYSDNGEIKFSEPLPFYETALKVSNLIISN